LFQRQKLDAQIILGRDLLGAHQVKTRLRLARIGDGGSANFKIALGKGQLLIHGRLLRPHGGKRVLRRQHVEIGLTHAHQQILRGAIELYPRQIDAALALLVGNGIGRTKQGLRSADGQTLRHRMGSHRRARHLGIGHGPTRRQSGTGQQAGARLAGTAGGVELRRADCQLESISLADCTSSSRLWARAGAPNAAARASDRETSRIGCMGFFRESSSKRKKALQ
jgi:hypothetical protein